VASLLISLFLGGFTVSQCTIGETGGEAAVHGIIMWGVVFAFLLWLTTTGMSLGFNAVMSAASVTNPMPGASDTSGVATDKTTARQEGESDAAYTQRLGTAGAQVRSAAESPRAISAAWWTFAGVLFSMLAAMVGAVCGSGPSQVVAGFPVRSRSSCRPAAELW